MYPSSLPTPTVASFMVSSNLNLASGLSLSCTVIHMPFKRNLLSSSQVTNWAKPPLHLLLSNFLCGSVGKFNYLCAETFRCTTMLQEAHSLKNNSDPLCKKFPCPSITCGLIRLLINTLHLSFDHDTVLPHLDFPVPRNANFWCW